MTSHKEGRRGIFFDLDNTLLPTFSCHLDALNHVVNYFKKEYNFTGEQSNKIIESFRELNLESPVDPNNLLDFTAWRKSLWQKAVKINAGTDINVDIDILYALYEDEFFKDMIFDKEAVSVLKNLRDEFKLIIITNGDSTWQKKKIERCNAMKYVDDVVIGGDHNLRKPTAELFLIACRKNGLEPKHCVIVGDKMSTDILGGRNAGFKWTVLLSSNYGKNHNDTFVKPDFCIKQLDKLHDVLEKIGWESHDSHNHHH